MAGGTGAGLGTYLVEALRCDASPLCFCLSQALTVVVFAQGRVSVRVRAEPLRVAV